MQRKAIDTDASKENRKNYLFGLLTSILQYAIFRFHRIGEHMGTIIQINHFPLQEETTTITSLSAEIHKILGHGFDDTVYKDALEYEFKINGLHYIREKEFTIPYKQTLLSYQFIADFIVFDAVIVEIRTKESITTEDYLQTLNHLKCTGCPVGLILNFGKLKLEIKRVAL